MKLERKTSRTSKFQVSGALDINDLYRLVQQAVPDAPADATIDLYVRVPGGGDWSSTDLDVDLETHVQFHVEWTEWS
jgi:hypothetical protein